MKPWMKKTAKLTLCAGLLSPALVACSNNSGANDTTERTLRIATMSYGSNDQWFRQRFTELFEVTHPNITLEIVPAVANDYYYGMGNTEQKEQPDPIKNLKEMMQGDNPPDVVMLDYSQMDSFVAENLLMQLDQMITKDNFNTADFVPAVIDGIKSKGNGNLYALANNFSSAALVYNKGLFDAVGAPYPKDGMTWEETFDLARQVARGDGEERVYGFSFNSYSGGNIFHSLMETYAAPLQLSMFSESGDNLTVDSDQWEAVWKAGLQLHTEKLIPERLSDDIMMKMHSSGRYNPFMGNDFMTSRVAMTIMHHSQLQEIVNANKNAANIEGYTAIDWDVATIPVHAGSPELGGQVYMDGLMGINAKAQNVADAWEFIKFLNSETYMKVKSGSEYNLMSRKSYIKNNIDGVEFNVDAFTKLVPAPSPFNYELSRKYPNIWEVQNIGYQKFEQVIGNNLGVRDALKQWQTEGDALLKQMRENPNSNNPNMPMPIDVAPAVETTAEAVAG